MKERISKAGKHQKEAHAPVRAARDAPHRKCACGAPAGRTGACEACSGKQTPQDESASNRAGPSQGSTGRTGAEAPAGRPLDEATKATMESSFGHDFTNVRVHVDGPAAESALALNASAYTVGSDVVFSPGKYEPESAEGKARLAHELAHVVQQTVLTGSDSAESAESEARRAGEAAASGRPFSVVTAASAGEAQLDDDKNTLDAKAKAIIALAKDAKGKPEDNAVAVVNAIIKEYYSKDQPLVDSVVFDDGKAASGVHAEQKFSKTSKSEESTGIIYVGNSFLKGVDDAHFARRVLQVGHEIEHIHQWREGLAGGHKSSEREFLAFYHEALLPEKPGTGRMQHSTRLSLIDAALGNFYCIASDKQKDYEAKKKELLDRRAKEISAGGTPDKTDAPTECKKSS